MRPEAVKSLTLIEPAAHLLSTSDPRVRMFLLKMMRIIFFTFSPAK